MDLFYEILHLLEPDNVSLDTTNSDFDAADQTIKLAWSLSSGNAGSYLVQVMDGNTQKNSSTPTSSPVTIYFSDMLNGHTYNVLITAKSEKFEGNQQVDGATFSGTFKTVVKGKLSLLAHLYQRLTR